MNKFFIKKISDSKYYWVLEDVYGRFIIKSIIHPSKEQCYATINKCKSSLEPNCFLKKQAFNGEYYFNQIDAETKQPLAVGNMYKEMIDRDIDIALLKSIAKLSEIVDYTMNVA